MHAAGALGPALTVTTVSPAWQPAVGWCLKPQPLGFREVSSLLLVVIVTSEKTVP